MPILEIFQVFSLVANFPKIFFISASAFYKHGWDRSHKHAHSTAQVFMAKFSNLPSTWQFHFINITSGVLRLSTLALGYKTSKISAYNMEKKTYTE